MIDSNITIGQVFNIGNDREITIEELALQIIQTLGSQSVITKTPYENAYNPGFEDMQRRIPDINKVKRVLGWTPILSLEAIISDVADHLR